MLSDRVKSQATSNSTGTSGEKEDKSYFVTPPTISLPKGGGAIKRMGEKFSANPVTGTGSMSVPIATTPGRSGFGASNGILGLGWNLSVSSITRKTNKGLLHYSDHEESGAFTLYGAKDWGTFFRADSSQEEL
jgi:Salmonella virulence plasmid 65kDa B protein